MNELNELYNEICRTLTDYEGNGDLKYKDDPLPLYLLLVKIQIHWNDYLNKYFEEEFEYRFGDDRK